MSISKSFIKKLKESVNTISMQNPSKEDIYKELKNLYLKYITSLKINKNLYYEAVINLIIYRALITKFK